MKEKFLFVVILIPSLYHVIALMLLSVLLVISRMSFLLATA